MKGWLLVAVGALGLVAVVAGVEDVWMVFFLSLILILVGVSQVLRSGDGPDV